MTLTIRDIKDDASGLISTGGYPMELYALIPDRKRRLLERASMRLHNGCSNDLRNGLLSAPDIHQDDASALIPTGGYPMKLWEVMESIEEQPTVIGKVWGIAGLCYMAYLNYFGVKGFQDGEEFTR